ncbi:MAG TPA: glycoside hydrolase family 57 protein [Gemmataceae bacterium]|jgi:alpha-amylase/alpha-mannosidase (GH57 family)|nr:glycoside hydrolase family 57 protein [Gemmataceae bacterium]
MAEVALAILWHQHQPYYPDDLAGQNPMPWVRLHGVKDYYGMALHLLEYPEMRCTINLVPSLLVQLQAYTDRGATDQFQQRSRIGANELSEEDALFLLDHFFMANTERMILPHPRYAELHQRRNSGRKSAREVLPGFSERDLRDLQVWFNLTWIHPLAFEQDANLRELQRKGRHFTEDDKNWVLEKHLEILRAIIPLHRQLVENGQVELTTTPFYHPILPLLFDKKLAREAMPEVKLPRFSGGYLEDAAVQVRRAVEMHAQFFGEPPAGMWPAEGSVCQTMIPLLAQNGIHWIATDEEVLSHSTQGFISRDPRGNVLNPDRMYRPYRVTEAGHDLNVIFRDHALSDLIGFNYQRTDPVAAADDFLLRIRSIGQAVRNGGPALVSVILDGENCWEHYAEGGVPFIRALYERCCKSKDIRPVQVGAHLEKHPPRDTLPHLFAGSWINHNFAIWIGHEEDNTAWDALHKAREHLQQRERESLEAHEKEIAIPAGKPHSRAATQERAQAIRRAWDEIYIAEGSDWFWWFGDDHSSAQDALFDYLFRKHLQNVYVLLGDAPPQELGRPISRRSQRPIHTFPKAFLDVKINGRNTFFEWISAGHYTCQIERGTMALVTRGPIRDLYFGFNRDSLLIRIDFQTPARTALADFDKLRVGFVDPSGWDLWVETPIDFRRQITLRHVDEVVPARGVEIGIDKIVELSIPFDLLGIQVDQPVQFFVEVLEGQQSRDRAPREGTINLTRPKPEFEQIMWDV